MWALTSGIIIHIVVESINRIYCTLLGCLQALHPYPKYEISSVEIILNVISILPVTYSG